jgi:hypothetical protein
MAHVNSQSHASPLGYHGKKTYTFKILHNILYMEQTYNFQKPIKLMNYRVRQANFLFYKNIFIYIHVLRYLNIWKNMAINSISTIKNIYFQNYSLLGHEARK